MDKFKIATLYQEQLNKITGKKLITVRIIENDNILCFNTIIRYF